MGKQLYQLFWNLKPIYNEYARVTVEILKAKNQFHESCLNIETDMPNDLYNLPDDFWTAPINQLKKQMIKSESHASNILAELEVEETKLPLPVLEDRKKKVTILTDVS